MLIKEMQALCLNVEVLSSDGSHIEMRDSTTTSSVQPKNSASTSHARALARSKNRRSTDAPMNEPETDEGRIDVLDVN